MRTEVSFQTTTDEPLEQNPAGDLATWLSNELLAAGLQTSKPENVDYAFALRCHVDGRDFYLLVGYVGDGIRQWLVSTNSGLGWLKRLLGASDKTEHARLTREIHRVLSTNDAISDIQWYTVDDWNDDPDNRWAETPNN